jgi:N-acetyl-anhydromuramyl-L-alanine amidase AmpD
MRKIELIVVHCSATREGTDVTIDDIRQWHRKRGFRDVGYHFVVYRDGTVAKGRPLEQVGAHVKGYNRHSVGICYIGGLSAIGEIKDTRTDAQKVALRELLKDLKRRYPKARICGHRDLSPDRNGDGVISDFEWLKGCPSFDAEEEYADL